MSQDSAIFCGLCATYVKHELEMRWAVVSWAYLSIYGYPCIWVSPTYLKPCERAVAPADFHKRHRGAAHPPIRAASRQASTKSGRRVLQAKKVKSKQPIILEGTGGGFDNSELLLDLGKFSTANALHVQRAVY